MILKFGAYSVDARAGEVFKKGKRIEVQPQPLQVLVSLLENAGDVVTREELRQKIWPADTFVDFEHSLNTAIKKLRQALGDNAERPKYIETLAAKRLPVSRKSGIERGESWRERRASARTPGGKGVRPRGGEGHSLRDGTCG